MPTLVVRLNGESIFSKPGMPEEQAWIWKVRLESLVPANNRDLYEVEVVDEIEELPTPEEALRLLGVQQRALAGCWERQVAQEAITVRRRKRGEAGQVVH